MSALGCYIVDAIVFEHRSPATLARDHGISRSWIYRLLQRFKEGGYASLEPRSRRPRSCSHQTGADIVANVLKLRDELTSAGHDAGPQTILYHLARQSRGGPSAATIWRILKRNGLITAQPHKRPRSSFIRFVAKLPNETWQLDSTPWQLADGTPVEILNLLDDHSRIGLASTCFLTVKALDVVRVFRTASNTFGLPASLLSDNAAVFTGRSRRGKVALESELDGLGIIFKHSTPYHPQTCGKVERFHQTLKRFLKKLPTARRPLACSQCLATGVLDVLRQDKEREGRDSNPRGSFTPPTRLAGGCFRPLSHLPDKGACRSILSTPACIHRSPYLQADGSSRRTRRAPDVGNWTQDGVRGGARFPEQGLVHPRRRQPQRGVLSISRPRRAA